ncbi:MAG TPA: hypothetical protein VKV04_17970, partial [Verrucomicrobiae bacterium]|nr:hypothetical protein [Verrucomicrobiae bacterium]
MKNRIIKSCWGGLLAGAMLLAGPFPAARAQSPVTATAWDCLLSGQRQGTAFFQFFDDGTFDVVEIIVPNAPSTPNTSPGSGGRTNGNGGRGTGGGSTNTFVPNQQIFGDEETNGLWALDSKGHVLGFFVEISAQESCTITPIPISTNAAPNSDVPVISTNPPSTEPVFCVTLPIATNVVGGVTNYSNTQICFTNATVCTATTNAVSFVGTVTAKHLLLKCSTPFGNTTYEGVPFRELPDASGQYSGKRKQAGVTYQEFLTLTQSEDNPNMYGVTLSGPGYSYQGFSMVSAQKRMAFSLGLIPPIPTNQVLDVRAVIGPFNAKKVSANMRGWDQPGGVLSNP